MIICKYKKMLVSLSLTLLGITQVKSSIAITFDDPVQIFHSASGEIWGADRFAPSGFESAFFDGDNRLKVTISAADYNTSDSSLNTQGYKYTLEDSATTANAELYLNPAWSSLTNEFRVGLWGNGLDGTGSSSVVEYPIISFGTVGGSVATPFLFRHYSTSAGAWVELGTLADFGLSLGDWVNLGFEINGDGTTSYFINGTEVAVDSGSYATAELDELIIQSWNNNEDYEVYWDNVASTVPEPSVSIYCSLAFLPLLRRRRV